MLSLLLAATLLVAGPERTLSDARVAGAAENQFAGVAAGNRTEILTMWETNGKVFGARIAPDGHLVDASGVPMPIPMRPGPSVTTLPAVIGTAAGFVAVWWDGNHLRSALIDNDLDVGPANDLGAFNEQSDRLAIAGDGHSLFVMQFGSSTAIYGRMLRLDGTPLGDWAALGQGAVGRTSLIADSLGYLLLAGKETGVFGRRIHADGSIDEWQQIAIHDFTDMQTISAAADGMRILLVWTTQRDVQATILDSATLVASEASTITHSPGPIGPVAAADRHWIVYCLDPGLTALVIDRESPTIRRRTAIDLDAHPGSLIVAAAETRLFAVWPANADAFDFDLLGVSLSADGVPSDRPLVISRSAHEQIAPRIADGSSVRFVVWSEVDKSAGDVRVRGTRVSNRGEPLDAQPIAISLPGTFSNTPDVAFDGENFLVTWIEVARPNAPTAGRLLARRIDENGTILDLTPFAIAGSAQQPSLACGAGACLVSWSSVSQSSVSQILCSFVSPNGSVESPIAITPPRGWPTQERAPDVAFGGGRFVVGWQTYHWPGGHSPISTATTLRFAHRDGSLSPPVTLSPLSSEEVAGSPKLAWNGSDFIAVWDGAVLRATMLGSLAPTIIDKGGTGGTMNDVAFINGSWLMTFSSLSRVERPAASGLYVSPSLRRELLFSFGSDVSFPALASDGAPVVVYERAASEWPYGGAKRVFLRALDVPATAEPMLPKRRAIMR